MRKIKSVEYYSQIGKKPQNVKEYNNQLVLSIFRGVTATAVADISEMTGLSKTTISKIVGWLADKQIIIPTGQGQSTAEGGKKPMMYGLNPAYCYAILISAGSSDQLRCAVYNFVDECVFEKSVSLEQEASYEQVLDRMASLVNDALAADKVEASRISGVAILYDGIVDYQNGIILNSVHHNWGGDLYICKDLAARLPFENVRVIVDNATHFSGYAETILRRGDEKNKMIITWDENRMMGWSLLSGIELVNGDIGISGAFSHMILDPSSARTCRWCGARGCLEELLSLDSIGEYIEENRAAYPDSLLLQAYDSGSFVIKDIFLLARQGDALAYALMEKISGYFAVLVRNVLSLFSVQKIVFQGMFSLSGERFLDCLNHKYSRLMRYDLLRVFNDKDIKIVYSRYSPGQKEAGKDPCLKGAAMLLSDLFIEQEAGK